jgi:universal stress protein E
MSEPAPGTGVRVLAGIDLSERSRNAFRRAVDLSRAPGSALTLVHVTSDAFPEKVAAVHETCAGEVLRDLAARAKADGVGEVAGVLVRGRDFEMLIEEAGKTRADLVVIGTHRPSSLVQDMLGTTADRLVRHGARPLLLVKTKPAGPYASVLVPVDFSPASRRALEAAIRFFPAAALTVLTAYGAARRSSFREDAAAREAAAETRRLALKGFIDEVGQSLAPDRRATLARITPVIGRGWAEDVILRTAEERKPDLIVVGTHARGGLQQAVLGSVAEWILTEAPCDVLAVPPAG